MTADGAGPGGVKGTAHNGDDSKGAGPGGVKGAADASTPAPPVSADPVGVKGTSHHGDDSKAQDLEAERVPPKTPLRHYQFGLVERSPKAEA